MKTTSRLGCLACAAALILGVAPVALAQSEPGAGRDATALTQRHKNPKTPTTGEPKAGQRQPPKPNDQDRQRQPRGDDEKAVPRPAQPSPPPAPPRREVYVHGGYGYPFGYPWYTPYWGGVYWWDPYQPPYWRYRFPYDRTGSVRLDVRPRETEVFVNGYAAGIADDFDGIFQRLQLTPGEYVITCHLAGFDNWTTTLLVLPGRAYHLRHTMVARRAGEADDARPLSPAPLPTAPLPTEPDSATFGAVSVRVQPSDAAILIDGEPWQRSGEGTLVVQLRAGLHRVDIRKPGYLPFSTDVSVRTGETVELNVSLSPGTR